MFRFKQFAVDHDRSSMKVGTDAVLLGAWCDVGGAHRVLDVGTGCGVIALMVAQRTPGSCRIHAIDIDQASVSEAQGNFLRSPWSHRLTVQLVDVNDFFSQASFDLIVSNPPYICNKEREQMEQNVLEHEPHTALFVPDEDPLLFYRTIAAYGLTALKPGGALYFEINPIYANEMLEMLSTMSYHDIEIKEDQFGKPRMINAQR